MPSIYLNHPSDSACIYHRILLPARFCADKFKEHGWEFFTGDGFPRGHDVYIFHGLPRDGNFLLDVLQATRRGKFIWSVDDDWLTIPDWNPAKIGEAQIAIYHMLKKVADYILVSTPALAETFADVNEKVLYAPNLIDLSMFHSPPSQEEQFGNEMRSFYVQHPPKGPVRIVWSGGITHSGDTEVVVDAIDKLLSTYGADKVVVIQFGAVPHPKLIRKHLHRGLFHQPMVPFAAYFPTLNSIESHIYLSPLATVPFNLSKSNLRIMEGWALAAAPIATDWGEYACIKNGIDGRLVSTPDQWYSALHRLVFDHETRITMALRGRYRVESEYDWSNEACRQQWYKVFSKIIQVEL